MTETAITSICTRPVENKQKNQHTGAKGACMIGGMEVLTRRKKNGMFAIQYNIR